MFMMSVKADTPLSTSATVTWVSSDAWVASIMASVTLPCPAAAWASAVDAVFWLCWTWSRALEMELEKLSPVPAAAVPPEAGAAGRGEMGGMAGDQGRHVPKVRADWYAVLASANTEVLAW